MTTFRYALEQLYVDQDHDWVLDTIPAVLAWVPGRSRGKRSRGKRTQPFRFPLEHMVGGQTQNHELELVWSEAELAAHDAALLEQVRRYLTGRTVHREHLAEVAAYGLTLVAISVLMPGRRVESMNNGLAPDFLFDATPGHLRGVETAGRSAGGRGALIRVRDGTKKHEGKRAQLLARSDIAEVSLSLWCASARAGIMEQVKP